MHPGMRDGIRERHPEVDQVDDRLEECARDAVRTRGSEREHAPISGPAHGRCHVRGEPGSGCEGVESGAGELLFAEAVVHPDPGSPRHHPGAVSSRGGDRAGETRRVHGGGVHGRPRADAAAEPPEGVGGKESRRFALHVLRTVEMPRAVLEHRALDPGDPPHHVAVPLPCSRPGDPLPVQRKHRGERGPADRRRRVDEELPLPHPDLERAAHDRFVRLEIRGPEKPVALPYLPADLPGQLSPVELPRPLPRDALQALRQTLDPDGVTCLEERSRRCADRPAALRIPSVYPLAAELEVHARGAREREPVACPLDGGLHDAGPGNPAVGRRGEAQPGYRARRRDGPVAHRRFETAAVVQVDVANTPPEARRLEAAARHLGIAVDHHRLARRWGGHDEGAAAERAHPRLRHQGDEDCGYRGVHGVAALVGDPRPGFGRHPGGGGNPDPMHGESPRHACRGRLHSPGRGHPPPESSPLSRFPAGL